MQRHDYAIVRCVTHERAPEWSYGGEVGGGGGHRLRVFALAKLNETNSELQRLNKQMTDLTISGWALKPHREFSVYFFKKHLISLSLVLITYETPPGWRAHKMLPEGTDFWSLGFKPRALLPIILVSSFRYVFG